MKKISVILLIMMGTPMAGWALTTETITPIIPEFDKQKICNILDSCPATIDHTIPVDHCKEEGTSVCTQSTVATQIDNKDYYAVTEHKGCEVCEEGFKIERQTKFCSDSFISYGPKTCTQCKTDDCDSKNGWVSIMSIGTFVCQPPTGWQDYSDSDAIEMITTSVKIVYGTGNAISQDKDNQCCRKCSYTYNYRCKAGYYDANGKGMADKLTDLECTKCPLLNNNANVNITSPEASTSISDCYINGGQNNEITDDIGTFYFENNCNHP